MVPSNLCGICDWPQGFIGLDGGFFAVVEAISTAYFYWVINYFE